MLNSRLFPSPRYLFFVFWGNLTMQWLRRLYDLHAWRKQPLATERASFPFPSFMCTPGTTALYWHAWILCSFETHDSLYGRSLLVRYLSTFEDVSSNVPFVCFLQKVHSGFYDPWWVDEWNIQRQAGPQDMLQDCGVFHPRTPCGFFFSTEVLRHSCIVSCLCLSAHTFVESVSQQVVITISGLGRSEACLGSQ